MPESNLYHGETEMPQFELLDAINRQAQRAKIIIGVLLMFCSVQFAGILYLSVKPPLVIRIDKLGNSDTVKNYAFETKTVTEDDIRDFTKIFLDDYLALKSNRIVDQMKNSLNRMTPELAKIHIEAMKNDNTVSRIQSANVRNDLDIKSLTHEESGDYVYVTIQGKILTRPLDRLTDTPSTKQIQTDLILTRTPRTPEHPYALLIHDVQMRVNDKSERVDETMKEVPSE